MALTEIFQLPSTLAASGLTVRQSGALDAQFLRALFATARSDAALLALLPASQREPFLDDQFRLQDVHYRRYFGGADFLVVEQHGRPVGRLILDRTTPEWQIVDIALLPSLRGRGIGGAILKAIQDAAAGSGAAGVNLQVEGDNRARTLYRRLGFSETGDSGVRIAMSWTVLS
jgi:ribosomal protein S18 acetylase RimI-like enzyme